MNAASPRVAYAMMSIGIFMIVSILITVILVFAYAFGLYGVTLYRVLGAVFGTVILNLFGLVLNMKMERQLNDKKTQP